jgi:hypothetical protein
MAERMSTELPSADEPVDIAPVEHVEFAAGSATDAYEEIQAEVSSALKESASTADVQKHVLLALAEQVDGLDTPDVLELQKLLDVDVDGETQDARIATVFEAALATVVRWSESPAESERGVAA